MVLNLGFFLCSSKDNLWLRSYVNFRKERAENYWWWIGRFTSCFWNKKFWGSSAFLQKFLLQYFCSLSQLPYHCFKIIIPLKYVSWCLLNVSEFCLVLSKSSCTWREAFKNRINSKHCKAPLPEFHVYVKS